MHRAQAATPSTAAVALNLGAVYVVWGSTYLAIRLVVETLPPFLAAGVRFVVAGALLFGFLWVRSRLQPSTQAMEPMSWRHWRSAAIVGALLLFGGNGFVSQAERVVDSGIAAVLIAAVPIWMSLFESLVSGRRPTPLAVGGVAAGFVGILVLLAPLNGVSGINPLGVAALVVAAVAWAFGSIYSRHAPMPHNPLLGTAMEMLTGGAVLFLAGLVTGEAGSFDPAHVSLSSALGLAYLVVFGSLVGFTAYTWLLKHAPVSTVATYAYVNPIVAVALGAILLHEQITVRTVVASILIIGAVIAMVSGRPREVEVRPAIRTGEDVRPNGVDRAAAD